MFKNEHHIKLSDSVIWLKACKALQRNDRSIFTPSAFPNPYTALRSIRKDFKKMTWFMKGNILISPALLRENSQYLKEHQKNHSVNHPHCKQLIINFYLAPFDQFMNRFITRDNRIKYVRYGTEFVIGMQSSKQKARIFYESSQMFIKHKFANIPHTLSFAHLEKSFQFYKYTIRLIKNPHKQIRLEIPRCELDKFASVKQYGQLRTFTSTHRTKILHYSEIDIMRTYNRELLAIAKYYRLADNFSDLGKLFYLAESSFLKTIANKRRSTVKKVGRRLRKHNQGVLSLRYFQPDGIRQYSTFIRLKDIRYLNKR
ncbi:MAG TPA: group II intron reverse transcriptase/maturase [Cerasibacillus sp.]|uniref:group II intron reverse transcriptase/maturase n=1 Tax=Cerasibacillus sp. TaxID=2498711 RepID=UPI002F3E4EC5